MTFDDSVAFPHSTIHLVLEASSDALFKALKEKQQECKSLNQADLDAYKDIISIYREIVDETLKRLIKEDHEKA